MTSTIKVFCDDCSSFVTSGQLHAHMDANNHNNYECFSIPFTYYNMRELLVQELAAEMLQHQNTVGMLFDHFRISRQFIPELDISSPVCESSPALFLLSSKSSYLPGITKFIITVNAHGLKNFKISFIFQKVEDCHVTHLMYYQS